MRVLSYFNTALKITAQYDGKMPLQHYLKQYFAANKKHGSRDRKQITHACYCYYRLGRALPNQPAEERLKASLFMCNSEPAEWAALFNTDWIDNWRADIDKRIAFVALQFEEFNIGDLFQFGQALSAAGDVTAFTVAHLIQPDLFIRVRPGFEAAVKQRLAAQSIAYADYGAGCIGLPNATKTEGLFAINREAVVQDYSSQRVADFFALVPRKPQLKVWDCCAASGGKSILAKDTLGNIDLTVTDIRPSIISNLRRRFAEAGIAEYNAAVADLSKTLQADLLNTNYDLIICDAPCSGSGTWGRTPEQLCFFESSRVDEYAALQKRIVSNAVTRLSANGYFLYITCSVFERENEQVAGFIEQQCGLALVKKELLPGYDKKADSMFAALFRRPL
ncbi:Fmu (Sun) domain-containing protein [Foetidibacter luteolus]|uniref:Fmu (Sun) domain-containing protein n=1 Tax=Foetidibacter luteolus TaxID=2608880 RepID=UPI00129BD0AA|nr:Fmu (Sun) domain-containing protein [Foetidibacter luteolus]